MIVLPWTLQKLQQTNYFENLYVQMTTLIILPRECFVEANSKPHGNHRR